MSKSYYLYILSNKSITLYIGVTSNLPKRLQEHISKSVPGFTNTYNLTQLVYIEIYNNPNDAISREKQLKKWRRSKKIDLIKSMNPNFEDLSLTLEL